MNREFLQKTKKLLINIKRLFIISWQMDPWLVFNYYLTAALGALAPVIASITLKYLIDGLQLNIQDGVTIVTLSILFILAAHYLTNLSEAVIKWGLNETYLDYLFRYKLQNEFSVRLVNRISKLDVAHLEDSETQNLLTKARDTASWRPPDFLRMFRYFFEATIAYIGAFIVLIPFGLWIPIVITIISIPRLLFRLRYGTLEWSVFDAMGQESRMRWYLMYLLTDNATIREMKVFQTQKALVKKFGDIQARQLKAQKGPLDKYLKFLIMPSVIEIGIIFIITAVMLPNVLSLAITIGSFTLIINMIDRLNASANSIVGNLASVYEHNLYVNQYLEVIDLPDIIKDDPNPVELDTSNPPKIEFRNVSFKYTDKYVLKNISFVVQPGESIALVGINGAGKSTIVKLLCRFYDIEEGEILINDINLKKIKLENWYSFLGTLFQDFVQYNFTVKENIQLSAGSVFDEERMYKAAKMAGADTLINELPNKYDQVLGREFEGGEQLSGGQWQKLAIARAFYESAPVLVLDEPTSAIDAESEYEIFNNLEKHYKNKTLIFVSHRFSTVRNAHRIFVIDEGNVIEEGSHQELMKQKGRYANMFSIQAKGYV